MLDVILDSGTAWEAQGANWLDVAERAARAAIAETPHGPMLTSPARFELSVKLSDDAEVRGLNAAYRDKDKPTNVLSFPMLQPDFMEATALADDGEILLGDVILAWETCRAEAEEKGVDVVDHATHLIVHGTLHLLGYDHELGEEDAQRMERMETHALASLGIADPYSAD